MMKCNQNGRTMLEMLGVLAITGLISVIGIGGFTKMMSQYKINQTIQQTSVLAGNISSIGVNDSSYEGLTISALIKMKKIPNEMIDPKDSTKLKSPIGNIAIASTKFVNGIDDSSFTLTYSQLTAKQCIAFASNNWGSNTESNLINILIYGHNASTPSANKQNLGCDGESGTGYFLACANGKTESLPVDLAKAAKACNCPKTNQFCTVSLTYY